MKRILEPVRDHTGETCVTRAGQGLREASLSAIAEAAVAAGIGPRAARWLVGLPFLLVGVFSAGIAFPPTRQATLWALLENRPVELLTFAIFVAAGIRGLALARSLHVRGKSPVGPLFFLAFAAGLLAIAGEEIAWGQQFFGFETPSGLKDVNAQGEMTLHNVGSLQEYLEVFPLAFGVGGLIGIALSGRAFFGEIAPPRILGPAFLVIASISMIDLFQEFVIIHPKLDNLVNDLDEVIELLIAMTAFAFLWLKGPRVAAIGAGTGSR